MNDQNDFPFVYDAKLAAFGFALSIATTASPVFLAAHTLAHRRVAKMIRSEFID